MSNRNKIVSNNVNPEDSIAKKLEELLNQKIDNPNSLIAMFEFKRFLDALPYGKIPFEILMALTQKAIDPDPKAAKMLLKFADKQEQYFQEHPDKI